LRLRVSGRPPLFLACSSEWKAFSLLLFCYFASKRHVAEKAALVLKTGTRQPYSLSLDLSL
jgi:hypothetical protein